ncbi:MAG: hypothetical protein ACRD3W_02545, partial [Terriglobales bacterium]
MPATSTQPQRTTAPKPSPLRSVAPPKRSWLGWMSFSLLAVLALCAIDVTARLLVKPDRYAQANRSWAWWAMRDLRREGKRPDVAILGSSLMLAVLHDGDATKLNTVLDATSHHRSSCLESLLKQYAGTPVTTASLAIGGQMASDGYALCKVALAGGNAPRAIVWGIAPRDFVDATFTAPSTSETVRYMNRLDDCGNVLGAKVSFWERCEQFWQKVSFIYGHRQEALAAQVDWTKAALAQAGWKNPDEVHCPKPLWQYAVESLPDDNGVKQWQVSPYSPASAPFADNTGEYKTRYNPFKPALFENQSRYFDQTLQYCK